MSKKQTTVLCILDGFGLNPDSQGNAVAAAQTPNFDSLYADGAAKTTLITHGPRVGLPEGQMGNSEVGHLNIGAGRVVDQWLLRISKDLESKEHAKHIPYLNFIEASERSENIHLIGLFSDGGVHSHQQHLYALLDSLIDMTNAKLVVHLITDGRDTSPQSSLAAVKDFEQFIADKPRIVVGSVQGRFYAMDRDQRWERVELAFRAMAESKGHVCQQASEWLTSSYEQGINDEFIEPAIVSSRPIRSDDAILFWNFRADRMREIVAALGLPDFNSFEREWQPPSRERVLCFTKYDDSFELPFLFAPIEITNYLGAVVAAAGKSQLRTAETEKYPHVTYFLNGGSEVVLDGEERSLVPSPRDVKTYDEKPEMSAAGICDIVVKALDDGIFDLIVVNFANCDMVGHTGVFEAAVKAVETVDACLGRIKTALQDNGGTLVALADHGNAEQMEKADGSPHTAHTTFPVPLLVYGAANVRGLMDGGALCDVAPTILDLMGIEQPSEMTGKSLLISD